METPGRPIDPAALDPYVRVMSTTLSPSARSAAPSAPLAAPTDRPPAVRAVSATKVHGSGDTRVVALDGVSVDIPAGRFTAIMGPSGSGKSTLMHCLAGLDTLTSGQVWLGDTELGTLNDRRLTTLRRERIGFVFQSFNLLPTLDAYENIVLPIRLSGAKIDDHWVDGVIGVVGLDDRVGHRPSELSGGQQQRVAVARALASRPQVVFADEPTGNLDRHAGHEVLSFLRRAVDDFDTTVVMVTHDAAAASVADDVLFLADGRIVDRLAAPSVDGVLDRMKSLEV
jgi:putative ABC transport system ATP-binding protein